MPAELATNAGYVRYAYGGSSGWRVGIDSASNWSITGWIRNTTAANRTVFELSDTGPAPAVRITTVGAGVNLQANLFNAAGASIALVTTAASATAGDPMNPAVPTWTLVIISHEVISGTSCEFKIIAVSAAGSVYENAVTYDPTANTIHTHTLASFGARPDGSTGMLGQYGPFVVRRHKADATDAANLHARKSLGYAVNLNSVGNWTGSPGAEAGIFLVAASHPSSGGACLPDNAFTSSALSTSNVIVLDTGSSGGSFDARTITINGTWTCKAVDFTFFVRGTPSGASAVAYTSVAGTATTLREFADGVNDKPRRKLLFTSNSRGTRYTPDQRLTLGQWPQHYAGGMILERLAGVCGTFAVRPAVASGITEFGADYVSAARAASGASLVTSTKALRRFGNGSNQESSVGPGAVVQVNAGGYYQTLTQAVSGTLYQFNQPRDYELTYLKYPGGPTVTLEIRSSATSINDASATLRVTGDSASSDTTVGTLTVVSVNSATREIVVSGTGHGLVVGWGLRYTEAGTSYDVTIISAVSEGGGNTTITVEHWFQSTMTISASDSLFYGPVDFGTLQASCTGAEAWASATYQGHRLTVTGTHPAFVLAEGWSTRVGYSIGGTGWGGHGYVDQITKSFTTPNPARGGHGFFYCFLDELDPDSLIVLPAQQQSTSPSYWATITTAMRAIRGSTYEVVWSTDPAHGRDEDLNTTNAWGDQDFSVWGNYLEANAAANSVCGLSIGDALGNFIDQAAAGYRADGVAHLTSEGNRVFASVLLLEAQTYALVATSPDPVVSDGLVAILAE